MLNGLMKRKIHILEAARKDPISTFEYTSYITVGICMYVLVLFIIWIDNIWGLINIKAIVIMSFSLTSIIITDIVISYKN